PRSRRVDARRDRHGARAVGGHVEAASVPGAPRAARGARATDGGRRVERWIMTDEDREQKVDLSSLDPSRDKARWAAMIARTEDRAVAAVRPRFAVQVRRWWVGAVGLAAAVAMGTTMTTLKKGSHDEPGPPAPAAASASPSTQLLEWASSGEIPSDVDVMTV